jgi:hypothetical protein
VKVSLCGSFCEIKISNSVTGFFHASLRQTFRELPDQIIRKIQVAKFKPTSYDGLSRVFFYRYSVLAAELLRMNGGQ